MYDVVISERDHRLSVIHDVGIDTMSVSENCSVSIECTLQIASRCELHEPPATGGFHRHDIRLHAPSAKGCLSGHSIRLYNTEIHTPAVLCCAVLDVLIHRTYVTHTLATHVPSQLCRFLMIRMFSHHLLTKQVVLYLVDTMSEPMVIMSSARPLVPTAMSVTRV